jgi:hypothetical protein
MNKQSVTALRSKSDRSVVASLVLFTLVLAGASRVDAADVATSRPTLATVVTKLSSGSAPSRNSVERVVGVKLKQTSSTDSFLIYTSSARVLADARLTRVELRLARKGVDVTAGPLLILEVDTAPKRCFDRSAAFEAFGPLELWQTPSGKSVDELTAFSRVEPWGRFSIGFTERTPKCVASITFNHALSKTEA